MKRGSLGLVFPNVSQLSLPSPREGTPKFWGCMLVHCCLPASHAIMEAAYRMSHCSLLLPEGFYFGVFFSSLP